MSRTRCLLALVLFCIFAASGCRPEMTYEAPELSAVTLDAGEKLRVVATTSIVADVVQNVGGNLIDLAVLVAAGGDPHSFDPAPQDIVLVSDAHVVFANGVDLESFLDPLLESAGAADRIVHVSHDVELIELEIHQDEHDHEGADPHTWFDPNNVIVWTRNIEHALGTLDPDNAERYKENADVYEARLRELDAWIQEQVAQVPEVDRVLATDHDAFGYLIRRYGFTYVGAVVPGYSTVAEPSAQDMAALEDAIRELGVKAILVGSSVNPDLAERVASDTGAALVFLYSGSLSEAGGPADTYIAFMRYNVSAIIEALR